MPYDSRDTLNDLFATGLIDLQRGALFDAVPQVHAAAAWHRVEGMLLGLAIGDALGNTSESLRPGERQSYHGEVRDYLPNPYADGRAVGLPSDLISDILQRAHGLSLRGRSMESPPREVTHAHESRAIPARTVDG